MTKHSFFQCTIITTVVPNRLERIGFAKIIYKIYQVDSKNLCFIFLLIVKITKMDILIT